MVYEKEISSFAQLIKEAENLDIDGGIRMTGRYKGRNCFIFLTKTRDYTLAVYNQKRESKVGAIPDERLLIKEFKNGEELEALLKELVAKPVKAYSY